MKPYRLTAALALAISTTAGPTWADGEAKPGTLPGGARLDPHDRGGRLRRTARPASGPKIFELENTSPLFLLAEFGGAVVIFATYSILAGDVPTGCGWCEVDGIDESLQELVLMSDSRTAATISHVLALGVTPAVALAGSIIPAATQGQGWFALQDTVILLNTFTLTTGLADGTKKLAKRQRPAFYYEREQETEFSDRPEEEYLSFYSGDTAWAFTFASAGATLAFQRGYWTAPYVGILGGAAAITTGILRISADAHWPTDVAAGAIAGSAVGFAIPTLLHPRAHRVSLAVVPSLGHAHAGLAAAGFW